MRVARLGLEGDELAALEHEGQLYRVDHLDDALGSPLPRGLWPVAGQFQRRVFSLALVGLDDHDFELRDGLDASDCVTRCPPAWWLPPCGQDAALFELGPGASSPLRLEGRSLLGHEARARAPAAGGVVVSPCVGLIVSEDLRLPSALEVERSLPWMSLGLAWTAVDAETRALAEGLGRGPGRELGTHLGPWLQPVTAGAMALQIQQEGGDAVAATLEVDLARVAEVMSRRAGFAELRAGDVVLLVSPGRLAVEVGRWVDVESSALGRLRGRVG
jgi:hypothetical protein